LNIVFKNRERIFKTVELSRLVETCSLVAVKFATLLQKVAVELPPNWLALRMALQPSPSSSFQAG